MSVIFGKNVKFKSTDPSTQTEWDTATDGLEDGEDTLNCPDMKRQWWW